MNNSTSVFSFLMLFAGLLLIQPVNVMAQHQKSDIKQLLKQRDQQIKDLLGPKGTKYSQKHRDKLKDIINGIVDYREMAEYALQETYDTLSTEQRKEFVDLFSTIIRDQSLNNLDIYRAKVKYENIEISGDSATVNTLAQLEKVRTPVTYNMLYKENKDGWVVTDIVIDDVSTAQSYRRQFQNILNKKGFNYLMKVLRKRAS